MINNEMYVKCSMEICGSKEKSNFIDTSPTVNKFSITEKVIVVDISSLFHYIT